MKYILLFVLVSYALGVIAQKPPIDTTVMKKWASAGGGSISPDGNYVTYTISGKPHRLVIQSTHTEWKKEFFNASGARFTNNSKQVVFNIGQDSLGLTILGQDETCFISHTHGFTLPEEGDWLAYRLAGSQNELVLLNIVTARDQHFPSVTSYFFAPHGNALLLQTLEKKDSITIVGVELVSLSEGERKHIWSGSAQNLGPGNYAFDAQARQLAFLVEEKKEAGSAYQLWYYKPDMEAAVQLVNDQSSGIADGWELANSGLSFGSNGQRIFFGLRSMEKKGPRPDAVQVDVWTYQDTKLQSVQLDEAKNSRTFTAVLDIAPKKIIRLEQEQETITARSNDFVLIKHGLDNLEMFESHWNTAAQGSFWLVSLKDSSRKLIRDHIINPQGGAGLSPGGKWILYYDFKKGDYFSYEIATGIIRNITRGSSIWLDKDDDHPETSLRWVPWRGTWLANDAAVLIYDSYDIWLVDPAGVRPPLNVTKGYGRRHRIQFELMEEGDAIQNLSIEKKPTLLLKAINTLNKDRGFYRIQLFGPKAPELLTMGPHVYGDWEGYGSYNYPPERARNVDAWLVRRMSAREAPDYLFTTDFINFRRLTHIQPQKDYNWLTSELVHWRTPDGKLSDGILYKPEDFDPNKKYPIIFDYYEKRSEELNLFIYPRPSEDRINIPWFVSNGYLVFTPDIHYTIGRPGKSAYDAVTSAASYLAKMPWVNARRMGIQGHSFGGYETNYIITHTPMFAAACSASGISDLISWYGSDARGGYSVYWAERSQGRMGATPWQIPESYISNSPIFKADKVATPLLMMNNKGDETVPFSQGIELFTALRRLGKKVWMLQYDGEGHSLDGGKTAADYHLRLTQFFDHYLKGALAPKWMTRGIPAQLKGIDNGLELDVQNTGD